MVYSVRGKYFKQRLVSVFCKKLVGRNPENRRWHFYQHYTI